jgi:MerR family transcriptional regulator, copper efflux regulator
MPRLKIGALAQRTGTNAPTIRYYEEIGLLRSADRQSGGQRVYGDADVNRLAFIRRCREFGFSIEQVRSLVALVQDPQRSCMQARDLAQEHLHAVRAKLTELKALERSIATFIARCDASCAGGPGPDCVILDDLSSGVGTAAIAPMGRRSNAARRCGQVQGIR